MTVELEYPFARPTRGEDSLEVAPGVHWIRLTLPFALDHINVWLLEDGPGWTLVDTGIGLSSSREAWQELFSSVLGGRPLRRIVVTHHHPDHIGQAAWLSGTFGVPVHITRGELDRARRIHSLSDADSGELVSSLFRRHGLDPERADAMARRGNAYRTVVAGLPEDVRIIADGDTLRIGERCWQVVTGAGHAPEHACLHAAEEGLLISGDQVLPTISSNVSVLPGMEEQDPLAEYLGSLRALRRLHERTLVLPSHGLPFRGLHDRLDELITHHDQQLSVLNRECRAPTAAADLLSALFRRELDLHQLRFAMGECIAHLQHAVRRGDLHRIDGPVIRFVAVR